ncbi:hypothetical protein ElyMa_006977000 [Elysia marginata]|uniref:Uncharacterized protein n=1 Tax=Elysia marginata TaxID=1093978 RepID=A0AAV4JL20_9GAST|nr:hypothetical protein ElyMa_006977000 [Elysia marginata]
MSASAISSVQEQVSTIFQRQGFVRIVAGTCGSGVDQPSSTYYRYLHGGVTKPGALLGQGQSEVELVRNSRTGVDNTDTRAWQAGLNSVIPLYYTHPHPQFSIYTYSI